MDMQQVLEDNPAIDSQKNQADWSSLTKSLSSLMSSKFYTYGIMTRFL